MTKNKIAFSLSFIFILFIAAPVVLLSIDKSSEISFLYTSAEEEKAPQKVKIFEVFSETISRELVELSQQKKQKNNMDYLNNHTNPYCNLIVPPPEYS